MVTAFRRHEKPVSGLAGCLKPPKKNKSCKKAEIIPLIIEGVSPTAVFRSQSRRGRRSVNSPVIHSTGSEFF